MPVYKVTAYEIHKQAYLIEARDSAEAIRKVSNVQGLMLESTFEYVRMDDPVTWSAEPATTEEEELYAAEEGDDDATPT